MAKNGQDLPSVLEEFDDFGELQAFADGLLRHGLVSALDMWIVVEARPGYALVAPLAVKDLNSTAQVGDLWETPPLPSRATSRGSRGAAMSPPGLFGRKP